MLEDICNLKKQRNSDQEKKSVKCSFLINYAITFLAVMYAKGGNHSHKGHRNAKMYKKKEKKRWGKVHYEWKHVIKRQINTHSLKQASA